MSKYYFVTTLLPPLTIGSRPEIDSNELDFVLRQNLSLDDFQKVQILRRLVEIENIRRFWQGEMIEPCGNYDEKEIEENLLHLENYPAYVFNYMERYQDSKERLQFFPELLREFFTEEMKKASGFVKDYLVFEWQWRLVCTALRAKSLGRDFKKEFRFEDPEDPFVQEILEQSSASTYIPPDGYQELTTIFENYKLKPLELNLALSEWRFECIDQKVGWHTFDIDRILGYIVQFEIVEAGLKLDKKKGLQLIEKVAKGE
ncbi:MAG: hypothetical protein JWO53_1230 [Chlamydiia bacterium]|nr:hypothetical protein [Chlamydiia bacterium]